MKIELSQESWKLVYNFLKVTDQDDTERLCRKYDMNNGEEVDYALWSLYEELRVNFKQQEEKAILLKNAEEYAKEVCAEYENKAQKVIDRICKEYRG